MLDIKLIRERPDFVKGELAKRGVDPAEVDRLLEADQKRRKLQGDVDQLRADRKRRAREVGKLPPEERAAEIAKIRAEEADEEKLAKGEAIDASNPLLILGTQLNDGGEAGRGIGAYAAEHSAALCCRRRERG